MSALSVRDARTRRHRRVRSKVVGTAERPRLVVFRSNRGIEAQLVDDLEGKTLAAASWLQLKAGKGSKTAQAAEVGKLLAANAKQAGVETVLRMLLAELDLTMVLTGNMSVAELDRSALAPAPS